MTKMMKKGCALLLVLVLAMSLCACRGGRGEGADSGEDLDTNKTQLYVFNFNGGFGAEWLSAVKERFEELNKDVSYEEGKKGVQIVINNSKTAAEQMKEQISYNVDEVYFAERSYYYSLLNAGVLGDITEAVTKDLSVYGDEEGTTILDKLSEEQKAFYGIEENGETKYYGLPHYAGYTGIIYNVDLFEEEKYYFADGVKDAEILEDYFIVKNTDKKSAGPDGKYDTYDDGLPATFEEFYILCDYIVERGQIPFTWRGASYDDYLRQMMNSVQANIDGAEQTNLYFGMDGKATALGKATGKGFEQDAKATTIEAKNGYEMYRTKGRYYALEFMHKLATTEEYHSELSFNGSYSHMNAQETFLYAGHDNGTTDPIAMLVEGIWWENEAESTFNDMVNSMGDKYASENRRFALMPLPKASEKEVGQNVLTDNLYSMCFMKANIDEWKKPLALEFISFVNSNQSLVEFTQITNTPKALKYEMTEEEMSSMTYFGQSVIELRENSDIVYPFSKSPVYTNQPNSFLHAESWGALVDGVAYKGPAQAFYEEGISVEEYFNGMFESYKKGWDKMVY